MILKDFLPDSAISEFVQCYRIVHFKWGKVVGLPVKAYPPKPEVCLHFFLRDGEKVQLGTFQKKDDRLHTVLVGQQTSLMIRNVGRDFLDFQIVFQPTGVYRLTGTPSFELTNQYLDAENFFSKDILRPVYEALQNAKNYSDMVLVGDRFMVILLNRARGKTHSLDVVSRLMLQRGARYSLDYLAKETCLCTKQFERKFYERVGTHPKMYIKIIRLINAFNTKNAFPKKDWLETAIECGYYDYQHLAKDYKELTGYTPIELHLLEGNSPESTLSLTEELYKSRIPSIPVSL